ncbi:ABC transporter ATP-binding protein [Methanoplanus sp. FWC-SCC4]|uniref:ABC transporter ATP-binding protein n=1 Tax=Methanochimaera problematica TaxID=2609417 RepID=A0AA97FCJ0_9EURY|nr:ABC transporter ATP-binding protein [Methanoplanus sp. FWC-SCC4]WOF16910.1 ABC transporter ATP-binding protein [Methanoplanus sp. FWC-SCC4]
MNAQTPVIELKDVSKIYSLPFGDVTALNHVSLEVMPGDFLAIMGPSGSGKSTMLNLIGSLDVPTDGDLFIDGTNIKNLTDEELTSLRRDNIGFIFQQFNLLPLLTVKENVEYPYILKYRHGDYEGRCEKLLERVGLTDHLMHHKPTELSGGQQQRVAIARALINNPKIMLCDEPTGNLDSKTGSQVMDLLAELNRQGKTVIMVTHDADIAEYANKKIVITDGEIK